MMEDQVQSHLFSSYFCKLQYICILRYLESCKSLKKKKKKTQYNWKDKL